MSVEEVEFAQLETDFVDWLVSPDRHNSDLKVGGGVDLEED